jgi:hypothetical protein
VASSTRAHRPDCTVAMAKQDYLAGGANYFGNRKSNEAAAPNNGDLNGILRSRLATDAWKKRLLRHSGYAADRTEQVAALADPERRGKTEPVA